MASLGVSLGKGEAVVVITCLMSPDQRKWIGASPYRNITPLSALETPNRVLSKVIGIFFIRTRVHRGVGARVVAVSRSRTKTDRAVVLRTSLHFVSGFFTEDT